MGMYPFINGYEMDMKRRIYLSKSNPKEQINNKSQNNAAVKSQI